MFNFVLFFLVLTFYLACSTFLYYPYHTYCTTFYSEKKFGRRTPSYRYDYPLQFIHKGRAERYFPLHCINPAIPTYTYAKACDRTAPPHVDVILGDTHVYVSRRDDQEKFDDWGLVYIFQICLRNVTVNNKDLYKLSYPKVVKVNYD
ncbi:hypothetical protein evm_003015 [Chilo suppressalis]|nr:hypothetical protein evm_003015 [Chilo suppressalis]